MGMGKNSSSKVPYLESPTLICLFTMQLYGATMMIKGSLLLSAPVVKRFRSTPPSRSRSLSLHCNDVMLHVYLAQNIISQRHEHNERWTLQQLSSSWVASVVSCLVLYSSEYMTETWHALPHYAAVYQAASSTSTVRCHVGQNALVLC